MTVEGAGSGSYSSGLSLRSLHASLLLHYPVGVVLLVRLEVVVRQLVLCLGPGGDGDGDGDGDGKSDGDGDNDGDGNSDGDSKPL